MCEFGNECTQIYTKVLKIKPKFFLYCLSLKISFWNFLFKSKYDDAVNGISVEALKNKFKRCFVVLQYSINVYFSRLNGNPLIKKVVPNFDACETSDKDNDKRTQDIKYEDIIKSNT